MKSNIQNLTLFALICALGIFSSCQKETPLPTSLGCDIDSDLVLTNNLDAAVDYTVDCTVQVNGQMTIEAGTVIEFANDAGFEFTDESSSGIIVNGTADNPVIMRGTSSASGSWKGIYIKNINPLNELNYLTISGAGSSSFNGLDIKAGIRVGNVTAPGKVKIQNCTIENSVGDGIYVSAYSDDNAIDGFSNNMIRNCTNYPVNLAVTHIGSLDGNTMYMGNGVDKIYVHKGNRNDLLGDHVWTSPGIPILVNEDIEVGYFEKAGSLTIKEGVELEFQSDRSLYISQWAYFIVEGTAENPVKMVGETPVLGAWKGIFIVSNDARNNINQAIIAHGGSSSHNGHDVKALIRLGNVGRDVKLAVSNSILSDSDCVYNRYVDSDVRLVESNVSKDNFTTEYCDF